MKRLSLRMRLTLIVLIIISAIAIMLTLIAMYNTKIMHADAINNVSFYMEIDPDIIDGIDDQINYDKESTAYVATDYENKIKIEVQEGLIAGHDVMAMESMVIALETMQNRFDYTSIIFMLIIIAAGGIITYFALGQGLNPVRQLSNEIEGITENELNVRVPDFHSHDEISKLAYSFNTLMGRLEKAFTEQKNFSTSAAHELKTPLAAIKSNIDVLEMESDPTSDEYTRTISVVKKQTERMTNLVDDLFSFSSGDYDTNDTVDLADVIDNIIEDLAYSTLEKKLSIHLDLNVATSVKTNRSILLRILSNLIGNAVSYTGTAGEICITAEEDETGYAIKIADNGPGISNEYTEKIFQPFFRIDASRSRKAGGAGLGLAIAKSMAEKIGGTISVTDNDPKGSIFILHLLK